MTAPTPASAAPPVRHTDQPGIAPARPHQGGVVSVKDRCAAALGERSPERINHRNGYRERRWETRAGALDPRIPKLRQGSYFPAFLEPRKTRRHGGREGLGEAYLQGVSTRSVGELVKAMGMTGISKSQVPRLCAEIDERVLGATRQGCRVALRAQRPRARSERAAPDGRRCDPHRLRTGRCRLCQPPMVDGAEADVLEWAIAVSSVSKSCLKVDRFRACPYRANRPKSQVRRGARPWTQIFRSRVSGGRVGREVDVDRSRGRRRTVVQVWASGLLSAAATVVLGQAPGLLSEVADVAAPVGANLGTDEPETDSSRASLRESGVSEDRNFVRGRLPWAMARSRLVHVDFAHLSAVRDTVALRGSSALRLNLFEDAGYEAVFERAAVCRHFIAVLRVVCSTRKASTAPNRSLATVIASSVSSLPLARRPDWWTPRQRAATCDACGTSAAWPGNPPAWWRTTRCRAPCRRGSRQLRCAGPDVCRRRRRSPCLARSCSWC